MTELFFVSIFEIKGVQEALLVHTGLLSAFRRDGIFILNLPLTLL